MTRQEPSNRLFTLSHRPDSLTGAILAVEGIQDAAVLLNGPTGCKFYHGAIAEAQLPRESSYDPLRFLNEFYFGQPRVPATFLDGDDYVFGASRKLERILPAVAAKGHSLMAVINSPGAALIGDDLNRFVQSAHLDIPCVTLESTGYSGTFEAGFQEAVIRVLEAVAPTPRPTDPMTVTFLGLSVFQKHWEGSMGELKRLLGLCGVRVAAVLCAGSRVADIRQAPGAAINVMVYEEMGDRIAEWCNARYGMETLRPCPGAPIGFDATEAWVREICRAVGASPDPALAAIDEARTHAVMHIKRLNSLTGLPKGATFAIRAPASTALPLTKWLYEYLGMIPVAVDPLDPESDLGHALRRFLDKMGRSTAWQRQCFESSDVVFADGATLAFLESISEAPARIEIALPSRGRLDIVNKSLLGAHGALHLMEWILNGLVNI